MAQFDEARQAFSRGDYAAARRLALAALEHLPSDAALHDKALESIRGELLLEALLE